MRKFVKNIVGITVVFLMLFSQNTAPFMAMKMETTENVNEETTTDVEIDGAVQDAPKIEEAAEPEMNEPDNQQIDTFSSVNPLTDDVINFDGVSIKDADATVNYTLGEVQAKTHVLEVAMKYAGDATNKTLIINLSPEMSLESAPGMKKSGASWEFDANTLPIQYIGIVENATYVPNGTVYDYKLKGGKLTYELNSSTVTMALQAGVSFDPAFGIVSGTKTVNNAVQVSVEQKVASVDRKSVV